MEEFSWDVFISYAREDKESVVRPLAEALRRVGVRALEELNQEAG
jgi:hypothetical protein